MEWRPEELQLKAKLAKRYYDDKIEILKEAVAKIDTNSDRQTWDTQVKNSLSAILVKWSDYNNHIPLMVEECMKLLQELKEKKLKSRASVLERSPSTSKKQRIKGGKLVRKSLDKCTVDELKLRANKRKVKITGLKKAEIIDKLRNIKIS
jgi:hypothetical protein